MSADDAILLMKMIDVLNERLIEVSDRVAALERIHRDELRFLDDQEADTE